jgi:hypothetical protein
LRQSESVEGDGKKESKRGEERRECKSHFKVSIMP